MINFLYINFYSVKIKIHFCNISHKRIENDNIHSIITICL
ncbi:hypothetical protein HFN_0721 [Helicobacter fennelliae MRY12-0050]|uniref:Uncharacterized protein n=1 Tax=Helicobacter fennelliae MRY12-0050 TaxID=1325130 RepID=T1D2R5_9HELI|nr:hypothetical protein HFN_0721 [Helicobacter fennelliae MRY12-0050]